MHWATPKTSGRMLTEPQEDEVKFSDEYEPTPYKSVGFRIATPPPSIWSDTENPGPKPSQSPPKTTDSGTAMRRRQFAVRRQSTIGAMVMAEKWDDNEIRRRFRNYEI